MRRAELALRKELAVTHLEIARTEIALARARRPDALAPLGPAVDLATSILEGHDFGRWGSYLRFALDVVRVVLKVRGGGPRVGPGDETSTEPSPDRKPRLVSSEPRARHLPGANGARRGHHAIGKGSE